ncbi:MAG: class I SAM-dependent methyltransferase [Flavobacteriales bacterium]
MHPGKGLEELGIGNVEAMEGAFGDTLPGILERIGHVDLAFIDGHHDREATLGYFEHVLAHSHEGTVLVFDDIHWSPRMSQAWARILEHPRATVTADLLHLGLVFLRKGEDKPGGISGCAAEAWHRYLRVKAHQG